jgi:hypothetical protein
MRRRCGVVAMLPEVDGLPGAEGGAAVEDGEGESRRGEGCADVGGHVVRAFGGVAVEAVAVRDEAIQEVLQVGEDLRVGVLLDDQRCGRVAHVQREEALGDALLAHPGEHRRADVVGAGAAGRDAEFMNGLLHETKLRPVRRGGNALRGQI